MSLCPGLTTPIAIIGKGGHAAVVTDIIYKNGDKVVGYYDDNVSQPGHLVTIDECESGILGTTDQCDPDLGFYVCAIGDNATRKRMVEKNRQRHLKWTTVIYPQTLVGSNIKVFGGVVICPGAIICHGVEIGCHTIINTKVSVDHDCTIGQFSHLAPGVTLCGNVTIGDCTLIGAQTVVRNGVKIGSGVIIGCGSNVVCDIPDGVTAFGNPAKIVPQGNAVNSAASGTVPVQPQRDPAEINWLAKKTINWPQVRTIMSECEAKNQFTNIGPIIPKLEDFVRQKFCIEPEKAVILTSNGTTALHALAAGLLKKNPKMRFATQSFTFPSSVQGPLRDITSVVDIDRDGGPDLDETRFSYENIDALIVTNVHGNVVDIEKYLSFCKQKGIICIFDNAATANTLYKGKNSCNYGTASIVSFHHTKSYSFGEGGCIIIDREYEHNIRCLLNFGIDNALGEKARHDPLGSNYRMCDINATFILSYLMDNFEKITQKHKQLYAVAKANLPQGFSLFPNFSSDTPVCTSICVLCDKDYDNTKLSYISRKYYKSLDLACKVSVDFYKRIICLPCNIDITEEQMKMMALELPKHL